MKELVPEIQEQVPTKLGTLSLGLLISSVQDVPNNPLKTKPFFELPEILS